LESSCGSADLDNQLARKAISNEYFDMFEDAIVLGSQFSCEEEYCLAHWCVKLNLSRAALNELFKKSMMPIVRNFVSSHPLIQRLNEMSYPMSIDCWKSCNVCYNHVADPSNICDHDYTRFVYPNPVEYIEFLMQQPVLRDHMSYAPATRFNDAGE
jgi:hypothetical protein